MGLSQTRTEDVLMVFKNNPTQMSTSDIISSLYPQKYEELEEVLGGSYSESREVREAKSEKASLHRRVLYHLNRLEDEGLIRVVKKGASGEKHYELNLKGDEEIILGGYRKREVSLRKDENPLLPIEKYEKERVVVKFSPDDWLGTVNSVLLDIPDLKDLYRSLGPLYREVNDVIAFDGFSGHLNSSGKDLLKSFFGKVMADCRDFDRNLAVLIDVGSLNGKGKERLRSLMDDTSLVFPVVFETTTKEFQDNLNFFEDVFSAPGRGRRIFFRNKDIHSSPCFTGEAGPYTFDQEEWEEMGEYRAAVSSRTSLMVDIKRFSELSSFSFGGMEDLLHKSLKSLFRANTKQRRSAESRFRQILNLADGKDPFAPSNNYLRFWNYDFLRLSYDSNVMEGVFRHLKKKAERFCESQEAVYTSCGMPTRFRTVFSLANSSLSEDFRTSLDKSRLEIGALKDLYADDFREHMDSKELLSRMFDGCFRLTLHKEGRYDPDDAVREVNIMLSTYKVPFFAYDTGTPSGSTNNLESYV